MIKKHTIERRNFLTSEESGKLLKHPENQDDIEILILIDDEVRKAEDDLIKNNHRSPVARKVLNKFVSKIIITNFLHQTSTDTTDGTNTKYEYINEFPTEDTKNINSRIYQYPPIVPQNIQIL